MRLKPLLYLTIGLLTLAICGAILKYLLLLPLGKQLFFIGMSGAQVAGLILIIINGSFIKNSKMIRTIGILALLPTIGYFVQWYSSLIGISLQLIGLLLILVLFARFFLSKPVKEVLDYLKMIWISTKISTSFLVVVTFGSAMIAGQIANILFYTMLIYFIWISMSRSMAKEVDTEEVSTR